MVNSVAYATKWILAFKKYRLVQSLQRNLCIKLLHLIGQTVMRITQFGLCIWKETYIKHTPSPTAYILQWTLTEKK